MVIFVGAGPGAADLITLRGKEALEKADVLIYAGSLVSTELLDYARPKCRIYDSAAMTLEEVIDVISEAENEGKMTVRLHTGDPSLYGAIREQIELLTEKGIEHRIVPGVSSFLGAAAALGSELTLPGVSQSVILSRMEGRTAVPAAEDIAALATHRATLVVFLSAGMLEALVEKLLEGGYTESTPAAIVYKVTWPDEKIVRTTVKNLVVMARRHNITRTALILVGDFLGDYYRRSKLYDPNFAHGYRDSSR